MLCSEKACQIVSKKKGLWQWTLFLPCLTVELFLAYTEGNRLDCNSAELREEKVAFMRSHASCIERLVARSLPLALVLGMLGAAFSAVLAPHWQVAHAANPSLSIVSPSSASGSQQTGIRVVGAGWNPSSSVQLFYSAPANNQPCGDPNNSQALAQSNPIPGVAVQVADANGGWTIDFQWPNTGIGQFYICAFDTTAPTAVTPSNQPFQVLSTTPPNIKLSNPLPNIGDQITIDGTGFLPGNQPIDLYLAQLGQQTGAKLATVNAGTDGTFSQQVTLPASPSGQLSVTALSRPAVNGALSPMSAETPITVGANASTPTPAPSGTVTPAPSQPTTPGTTDTGSSSSLILVALVVALALVILAIFGVLIWYVSGTRPPAGVGEPPPGPPPGRSRAPVAPRRSQSGWQGQQGWQGDDEWDGQQGPWEEDDQGGWSDLPAQWPDERNSRPQGQGPGTPPPWSGPTGRGNSGAHRPLPPRGSNPNRDDWPGRARQGQNDW